jgi:hypothetical protein
VLTGGARRNGRLTSAYTSDRPFSLDLMGAVIRQGSFIDKMANLGWTEPSFSTHHGEVFDYVLARYHA